jgi:hypothetical protein
MTVEVREHQKTPLWRNATVLKWFAQIVVLIGVIALFVIRSACVSELAVRRSDHR